MEKKSVKPRQKSPKTPALLSKDSQIAALPAITSPSPEDYHISLPNTEIGIHREAHVVFMIDLANRDTNNLQELADWYLSHGWFLDVVHVEPEPEKPTGKSNPTKIEQDLHKEVGD